MTRTITALYDSYEDAESAARDLEAAGVRDEEISLVANNTGERYRTHVKEGNEAGAGAEAGATFGAVVGGTVGILAGLGMLAIPGVDPVVAAGWLAAAAAGAVGGAAVGGAGGGLIGAMIGNGVPEVDAHFYAEGVRRGGTLVTVHAADQSVASVEAILLRHDRVDPAGRRSAYQEDGWSRFDENAPAFTNDEVAGNVACATLSGHNRQAARTRSAPLQIQRSYPALAVCCAKKHSISQLASGPRGSV
jgi:hypothetical protein